MKPTFMIAEDMHKITRVLFSSVRLIIPDLIEHILWIFCTYNQSICGICSHYYNVQSYLHDDELLENKVHEMST